jgi:hypothetical protein
LFYTSRICRHAGKTSHIENEPPTPWDGATRTRLWHQWEVCPATYPWRFALLGTRRRFANDIRWKELWILNKAEEEKQASSSPSSSLFDPTNDKDSPGAVDDPKFFKFLEVLPDQTGFGAHLKTVESKLRAPKGSDALEAFISDMESAMISLALEGDNGYKPNARAKEIKDITGQVIENDLVIIPADKTNSFTTMPQQTNMNKMPWGICWSIEKRSQEAAWSKLMNKRQSCWKRSIDSAPQEKEMVAQESLKFKLIPSPKLLVKDHKNKDKWGQFPTRFVIPATDFTSAFQKLGYLGVKIFDEAKIDQMKKTSIQASHAKNTFEELNIKKLTHTVFSLDVASFYPSVTCALVEIAINCFTKDLLIRDKLMIRECLKLIHFGMATMLS